MSSCFSLLWFFSSSGLQRGRVWAKMYQQQKKCFAVVLHLFWSALKGKFTLIIPIRHAAWPDGQG
jgi:hypothetical protein